MGSIQTLAKEKKIVAEFSGKSDAIALGQMASTVVPYLAVWYLTIQSLSISYWLTAACVAVLCLFLLRVFVLMHEAGHNSLFATRKYNQVAGFVLGVICGMPQYVWSKNHAFHHATNGNWDQYRGPLATLSVDEYNALSPKQQRMYRATRNIFVAPVGGFLYLIFNPRFTWIKGSLMLLSHIVKTKLKQPTTPIRTIAGNFECRYWKTWKDYRHMSGNNVVLLSIWLIMCLAVGQAAFFTIYLISLSLSGAGGIILFTVQHNFEDAWAADEAHWDYNRAAVDGTSFLVVPKWLNWFTANIAYHHIHHLSASIPNYRLAACHEAYSHLFEDVRRVSLKDIPAALKNNLWDVRNQRITSVAAVSGVAQRGIVSEPSI
ncbi:fatty acid desaturase [Marinobacter nanhaiticus D15-8W]|uniref:Fatty acid desaturase n=1 Tax=Marinobacter nanhaiticus D15-8W TaxID=626887 RepID=N6WW39_9GAMM|nr:fatty acid desaturase [Marinobacter nanhaiticus]ENO15786.1 fatty acid desaturase [Marinobacter nanhaiticus D15-8W]BES73356.1 fatty acid desaturase [Marinobacter nanhaiticus D15-8W]